MPGLLSTIFDGSDDADTGTQGSSNSLGAEAGGELHLDPSITISNTMSGSYESPDGTTHSWERTDSITLDTDTQIVTKVTAVLTDDSSSETF